MDQYYCAICNAHNIETITSDPDLSGWREIDHDPDRDGWPTRVVYACPCCAKELPADICNRCGGNLPEEGSEAWEASEGTCPGHLACDPETGDTLDLCGAFEEERRTG